MKQKLFCGAIMLAMIVGGCYPADPDYVEELDLVFSTHDEAYSFSGKTTYAMPDSIVRITGNLLQGEDPDFLKDVYGDPILARIEQNMTELGYTRVDIDDTPDLILAPAVMEVTTVYYDWWYYYGWYWGGYYPGWGGWYYPPAYPVVSSYSSGTLLMALTDPNTLSPGGTSSLVWTALANGLLTGTNAAARVNQGIDQAFDQSPYLKH